MKTISDITKTPVGGWGWKDPTTGYGYSLDYGPGETGLKKLMEHVARYRGQNLLPPIAPDELLRSILDSVCQRKGMEARCCDTGVGGKRTVGQYVAGAFAAAKTLAAKIIPGDHERSMVSQTLADRRAAVCLKCPLHAKPDPKDQTLLEKFTDAAMLKLIGSRRTEQHDRLQSCPGCTCCMRAKVWFKWNTIQASLSIQDKANLAKATMNLDGHPMKCWQLEEAR